MPLPVVEVAEESRRVDGVGMAGYELLELRNGLIDVACGDQLARVGYRRQLIGELVRVGR